MNIGLFAPYDLARAGGVATHIRAQARALRSLGHTVRIFGPASGPLPDGETALGRSVSITLGGTESGMGISPRAAAAVSRLLRSERFDVVHVHEPLMPAVPWWAVWFAGAPVVGTFHVHREQGHALYRVARPLLAPLMRRIDVRIAVSDAARRTVARYFPGQYEVIPNGIEPARFASPRPRPRDLSSSAGAIVLCVGRLEPRKGVGALIEAMARVQHDLPDVSLVVVGDGSERTPLESAAARCGARVRFCTRVPDEELPAFYQAADVVCAPALGGESFGIVLLEALASGRPVVASRIDGYVEVAHGSPAVRFVEAGDVGSLAQELSTLLRDAALRAQLAPIARAAAARYDWTELAERLTTLYAQARRGPRAA